MKKINKEIIQWACEHLESHGYQLKNNFPEEVKITPWSSVFRFITSNGYIYLKQTPELIALEANINQILHDRFHASVPEVIANNAELNCFMMKDAGRPLREILKNNFDADLLCRAINEFTSIQLNVSNHIDIFLNVGVPDWRLDKLPELFRELLLEKAILIEDGLSEKEISELKMLVPGIENLCKKLSDYSIVQTLVQPDFHDNNTLINETTQKLTFIDLGEIVISHPFFSLINCLHQAKKHHGLTEENAAYIKIRNACLKNYIGFDSTKNISDAFAIAEILLFVYGALAHYRLMVACGKENLMSFQRGKFCDSLKKLIAQRVVINGAL